MLELKEKMAHREAEANATIKELSVKFETINTEIIEEREKRCVIVSLLRIAINFVFQYYLRRKIIIILFYFNII